MESALETLRAALADGGCTAEQDGPTWLIHDAIASAAQGVEQGVFTRERLAQFMSRLRLEVAAFDACLQRPDVAAAVRAETEAGTGKGQMSQVFYGMAKIASRSARKVWLNIEHEDGFRAVVGHGVALRESPDALYGTFRVEPGVDGDKALHMVNEGILTGLSIEAIPTRTRRTVDGIVERVKARLDKVSLVRDGLAAYESARVLAVREAPPEEVTEPAVEVAEPAPAPEPVVPQTPVAPAAPTYVFNFGSNFTPEVLTQASVTASPPPAPGGQVEATEPVAVPAEYLKPAGSPRDPSQGVPAPVFRWDLMYEFISAIVGRRDAATASVIAP